MLQIPEVRWMWIFPAAANGFRIRIIVQHH
jgi:hypothetical protein